MKHHHYFITLWCWLVLGCATASNPIELQQQEIEALFKKAQTFPKGSPEQLDSFRKIIKIHPENVQARYMLSASLITHSDDAQKNEAVELMKTILVKAPHFLKNPQIGQVLMMHSALIGRDLAERRMMDDARFFLETVFELSKDVPWGHSSEGNLCFHLMLASLWEYWPTSMDHADQELKKMNDWAESVLNRQDFDLHEDEMSKSMPMFGNDPWNTCVPGFFPLSLYYRADTATVASRRHQMVAKVWPRLSWASPHIENSQDSSSTCRKTKIGIMSAVLTRGHPVTEDFQGVLQRLDRDKFDITYIFLEDSTSRQNIDPFVYANPQDELKIYSLQRNELGRGDWITRVGHEIAELKFDILLHLDMTMSSYNQRLGMMKLAPVQMNTHGHPITSGYPDEIVQYFVSWAEAELPYNEAQKHYTEKLKLIPMGKIHQYYKPRRLKGDVSRIDGVAFGHLTRADFNLPPHQNIYLNMQKPFKLHPEFDPLVCGILEGDPNGVVVLHRAEGFGHNVFVNRLGQAGCDMNRVHFMPVQSHNRLLALIGLSTVVLDSYPAGGCTTTREVFEMGKAVITLPARLLGGRWTVGLYNVLGMSDLPVIASTFQEYIDLAVDMGTNTTLQESTEKTILEKIQTMFYRDEAVEEWENILLEVSPVYDEKDNFCRKM